MVGPDGSGRLVVDVSVRFLSQLRHALQREPGEVLPVGLGPPETSPVMAGLEKAHLESIIGATEAFHDLGLHTRHFSPPVYLQYFWGHTPTGRPYGKLDLEIAHLARFNLMPKELHQKARDPRAEKLWAVVTPARLRERRAILAGLEPLIRHRGGNVLELSDGHDPSTVLEFAAQLSRMPIPERPYFLLLLGDLDELTIEFQYVLQSFSAAGRLHLARVEDYALYAEKVIRHETALEATRPTIAFAASDTDEVAALNEEELVRPLATEFGTDEAQLMNGRATKPRVLQLARTLPERSVLFLAAHGYECNWVAPSDPAAVYAEQEAFQGSPILDDFVDLRWPNVGDGLLCASDLAGDVPCAKGGVVILHACYSAGTVERDTLPEWIHLPAPPHHPPRHPFVSRLSQAMLASPTGPIAVYGHINRSHQYAWFDPDPRGASGSLTLHQYRDMLAALARGDPIGVGRDRARRMTVSYMSQALQIADQIKSLLGSERRSGSSIDVEPFERSFVQYCFGSCNFRNYIILGDPLARVARTSATPGEGGTG
jgi:hypothetical protein